MAKTYLGRELKPPFDGPQFTLIDNPDKADTESVESSWIKWLTKELENMNDVSQLLTIRDAVNRAIRDAEQNEALPDQIKDWHWTGSVQCELIRCGKKGCKCETEPCHGPYFYHYS